MGFNGTVNAFYSWWNNGIYNKYWYIYIVIKK